MEVITQSVLKHISYCKIIHSLNLRLYLALTWLLSKFAQVEQIPMFYFMTDKAWFYLSMGVNSKNTKYCSAQKPQQQCEKTLQDEKIGVWCVIYGNHIMVLIFFAIIINTKHQKLSIHQSVQLTDGKHKYCIFQQDRKTCLACPWLVFRRLYRRKNNHHRSVVCMFHRFVYKGFLLSMELLERYSL